MPAPSPSTKPSRSLSNGRDACVGSSLRVDIAFIVQKPPIAVGMTVASLPPVTTATASPRMSLSYAVASASLPLAHADATANTGPRSPNCIEMCADAAFAISIGTKNGEMRSHFSPGPTSNVVFSTVMIPPIPVATMAPVRARTSGSSGNLASSIASLAATSAIWA